MQWTEGAAQQQQKANRRQGRNRRGQEEAPESEEETPMCRVPGCPNLAGPPRTLKRCKLCKIHSIAPSVDLGGGQIRRWCQQCRRWQPLDEFDGTRRSCIAALQHHNARRQEKRRPSSRATPQRARRRGAGAGARSPSSAGASPLPSHSSSSDGSSSSESPRVGPAAAPPAAGAAGHLGNGTTSAVAGRPSGSGSAGGHTRLGAGTSASSVDVRRGQGNEDAGFAEAFRLGAIAMAVHCGQLPADAMHVPPRESPQVPGPAGASMQGSDSPTATGAPWPLATSAPAAAGLQAEPAGTGGPAAGLPAGPAATLARGEGWHEAVALSLHMPPMPGPSSELGKPAGGSFPQPVTALLSNLQSPLPASPAAAAAPSGIWELAALAHQFPASTPPPQQQHQAAAASPFVLARRGLLDAASLPPPQLGTQLLPQRAQQQQQQRQQPQVLAQDDDGPVSFRPHDEQARALAEGSGLPWPRQLQQGVAISSSAGTSYPATSSLGTAFAPQNTHWQAPSSSPPQQSMGGAGMPAFGGGGAGAHSEDRSPQAPD